MSCNKAFYIKNVPVNAKWEIEEAFCISFKDLTKAQLAGKYFVIFGADGTKYAPWFDDGVAADPVVSGATLVPIDLSAATTPSAFATATKTAIDAATDYTGTISDGYNVSFVYVDTSKITAPLEGTAGSLIAFSRGQIGGSIDLGLLDGDVTFDPSVETVDITAHQTGAVKIGQLISSVGGEVSLTLKEYSPARYREIFEAIGGKVSGTSVTGFGSAMVGKNLIGTAKRLVLHPVYKGADKTEDYTVWKAVPELGSVTFSGENPNTLPLTFTAYIDESKASEVNVWAFGDIATLP